MLRLSPYGLYLPVKRKRPKPPVKNSVKWLVNRFPATISTWTDAEWERLTDKPSDAQRCDNGIWVALRMD